jgi:hypothetical protein
MVERDHVMRQLDEIYASGSLSYIYERPGPNGSIPFCAVCQTMREDILPFWQVYRAQKRRLRARYQRACRRGTWVGRGESMMLIGCYEKIADSSCPDCGAGRDTAPTVHAH